ncbi:alpha-E domain-containing protein [Thiosulfatihalobacter marinus]|uniref:alpha-E domain-containing protein n=1 Tax=Thiosulfatihalobacter marinus TaxID=2792481 RepID=UPI0018D8B990|nr:alpha-E domain-containing protein [Thiosulfatihalobacter marinus]
MLGKTANGLFWMSRYLERAENTARLIETGQRIALTRLGSGDEEWTSIMKTAGVLSGFMEIYDEVTQDAAVDWMMRDHGNPSSIQSCILGARQNARMVRAAITGETWEAINATYMSTKSILGRRVSERDLPTVLSAIRQHTALVRGMVHGTMLRNDIYDFLRVGTFLERADNTARILDVKYYVLLPSVSAVGSSIDNVQWEIILRSVSARGGFRMEYGAEGGPQEIADFLILNRRMPRSLAFCVGKMRSNLAYLNADLEAPSDSQKLVAELNDLYLSQDISAVFEFGLHEFIQKMLSLIAGIAGQVEKDFRFYE